MTIDLFRMAAESKIPMLEISNILGPNPVIFDDEFPVAIAKAESLKAILRIMNNLPRDSEFLAMAKARRREIWDIERASAKSFAQLYTVFKYAELETERAELLAEMTRMFQEEFAMADSVEKLSKLYKKIPGGSHAKTLRNWRREVLLELATHFDI